MTKGADKSDDTEEKQTKPHLYKPGQTGNPFGRPKGSKNKLSEDFLRDLLDAWDKYGVEALKVAATEKQSDFCKMVASLIPKEITVKNELSEFSDEQLAALGDLAATLIGNAAGFGSEDRKGKGSKARH